MIHHDIKEQIKDAMRNHDHVRLDTLRGLNALFLNEMLMQKTPQAGDCLPDDKAIALIKRSVKQRKDSIAAFEIGKRKDLADKERAELAILETFLPASMSKGEIRIVAAKIIEKLKSDGQFDPKAGGKITGMVMKELAGKADGGDVKSAVEELIREQ